MNDEIKPKVNIRKASKGKGFIIERADIYGTDDFISVTREELEQIVLYGEIILKDIKEE